MVACSRPPDGPIEVRAQLRADGTYFVTDGPSGCADELVVRDGQTGQTAWHIERTWAHPLGDKAPVCRDIFPLRFGQNPPGFREVVPAMPLRTGAPYNVFGKGQESRYAGEFRLLDEGGR